MTKIVVVGGGVIGLLSAWTLARDGATVELVERGETGREASWAGGGIVSPLYPWRYSPAVTALSEWSQAFYPALAERLLAEVGLDPEVHVTGLYWLDLEDEAQALAWGEARGLGPVPMARVHAAVPPLGHGFARAVHLPDVANVRNPRLAQALRAALEALPNVTVREHQEVIGLLERGGRIHGVRTPAGSWEGDAVVVAAGAWSGDLLAPLGVTLPVEPVKGQMILYRCAAGFLGSMVLAKGRYAIPRRDGHVLVGSTLEHAGYDKTTTEEALASLRATAGDLIPALATAPVIRQWAGLRPGSPEGVPFIGDVPGYDGLWVNSGHYRNGLVLAPASCRLLADLLQGRAPVIDPAPYALEGRLVA